MLTEKYWKEIHKRNESTLIIKEGRDLMGVLYYRKEEKKMSMTNFLFHNKTVEIFYKIVIMLS